MPEASPYDNPFYAHLYEWTTGPFLDDLPFYLELKQRYGGRILELACGTGRLSFPLAQAGAFVTGLELAPGMLDIAVAKLSEADPQTCARLSFTRGDMRHFNFDCRFDLIILPLASLYHIDSQQGRQDCLQQIHAHLRPGGAAVIDIHTPLFIESHQEGEITLLREGVFPFTGQPGRAVNIRKRLDPEQHLLIVEEAFIPAGSEKPAPEHTFTLRVNYVYGDEMDGLFHCTRFREIQVFGDYDFSPFTVHSDRMLFVASP